MNKDVAMTCGLVGAGAMHIKYSIRLIINTGSLIDRIINC